MFHPADRTRFSHRSSRSLVAVVLLAIALLLAGAEGAIAQTVVDADQSIEVPAPAGPETAPVVTVPDAAEVPDVALTVESDQGALSNTVTIIVLLTIAAVAPAILLLMTAFTRFVIVLGLTRNALGAQSLPPAQVLIGLSLILTIFVMSPVIEEINAVAVQPLLAGESTQSEAMAAGYEPLEEFMLAQTREDDLRLFLSLSDQPKPESPEEIAPTTLIPAFVISELRTAFVIGFLIFIPFLVIDLIVSAILMSLGMMMLPPIFLSLPLKLLLFVLVDGWALIIGSVVQSVNGVGT